jgi:hypothetical protein
MSRIIFWGMLLLVLAACVSKKGSVKITSAEIENQEADSLEYELVTFDSRFEVWYEMKDSPALYRSLGYYENWNRQYVSAWNTNSLHPGNRIFYEPVIGYEPNVDYGLELNHRLFYYFQYVENVLKIPILAGRGPKAVF